MQGLHKCLLLYVLASLGQNGHGITGGEIVPDNKMQYMVSLQKGNNIHLCGGFLVSKNFVITSASCDQSKFSMVYYGCHNLEKKKRYRYIDRKCISTDSDIMLLKLDDDIRDDNVKTIELPNSDIDLVANKQCVMAGWGPDNSSNGSGTKLRTVNVCVINQQVCQEKMNGLPANVICAGGYERGFCKADAGCPLLCDGKVAGVVLFDKMRNGANFPSFYTDISKKHQWIKDRMNNSRAPDCKIN